MNKTFCAKRDDIWGGRPPQVLPVLIFHLALDSSLIIIIATTTTSNTFSFAPITRWCHSSRALRWIRGHGRLLSLAFFQWIRSRRFASHSNLNIPISNRTDAPMNMPLSKPFDKNIFWNKTNKWLNTNDRYNYEIRIIPDAYTSAIRFLNFKAASRSLIFLTFPNVPRSVECDREKIWVSFFRIELENPE